MDENNNKQFKETSFNDTLFKVPKGKMHQPIHKHIGALTFRLKGKHDIYKGTSTLISPNLVLTAAHNIFDSQSQQTYMDFKFYNMQCGILKQYHKADKYFFPQEFKKDNKTANDYAILKLKNKIQEEDFIPLWSGQDIVTKESEVSIFGYPTLNNYQPIDQYGENLNVYQFGLTKSKSIIAVRKQHNDIVHIISTQPGHSGSPLLIRNSSGKLRIVGVHTGWQNMLVEGKQYPANYARLVTSEMISMLKREASKIEADAFMDKASEERKEKAKKQFNAGVQEYCQGRYIQAADHFRKAIMIDHKYKEAHCSLGNALYKTQDLVGAVESYNMAIKINQKYSKPYLGLGRILEDNGDPEGAVENYNMAIKINLNYSQAYLCKARILDKNGNQGDAAKNYRMAIKIDPNYKLAYVLLAKILDDTGEPKSAAENYSRAIAIDPYYKLAYLNFGNLLFKNKKLKGAAEKYSRAIEIDPYYKMAYNNLFLLMKLNNKKGLLLGVIKFVERQVSKSPDNAVATDYLAKLRMLKKL